MASKPQKKAIICKTCNVYVPVGSIASHNSGRKHKFIVETQQKHQSKASCTIHVSKMPAGAYELELSDFFSKYDTVSSVYFSKARNYAFVEFSTPIDKLGILNMKHNLRGQEMVVKRANVPVKKVQPVQNVLDITKGNQVIDRIKDNMPLERQVQDFMPMVLLTEEDLLPRGHFIANLTSTLQQFFPGCRLEMFGSTVNSLGFKGCDLDLSIFLPFERDEKQTMTLEQSEVPTPFDVHTGKFPVENLIYLSRGNLLYFLHKFMSRLPGFKYARFIPSARCPIIKFYCYGSPPLTGDISFCKSLGLANTHLLHLYCKLHYKVHQLLTVLRYWIKREELVGGSHLLTSYAFNWLVIFYLQVKKLVPTIEVLASHSDIKMEAEGWDCTFTEDISRIRIDDALVKISLGRMISGFFEFYSNFDFTVNVICPRDGSTALKSELLAIAGEELDFKITSMSVQDVFDLTHNITGSVNDTTLKKFLSRCQEQNILWMAMIKEKKFNLKRLFQPPPVQVSSSSTDRTSFYIPLASETTKKVYEVSTLCNFVLDILRRAFSFKCNVIKYSPEISVHSTPPTIRNSESRPTKKAKLNPGAETFVLSVLCKIFHRTWIGRKNVKGIISTDPTVTQLEVEESIAKEVVRASEDKSGRVLYTFETAFLLYEGNQSLRVMFVPKSEKNELTHTAIPFIKRYFTAMTESYLEKYVVETEAKK